jgi:hydrogenase nickel incorporation protein HypA/HybF
MHELSIALGLIDLAAEEAVRQGSVRVAVLYLRIGPLSGVTSEALQFSFELAAEGTPVEGARLEIEETLGRELELTAMEVIDAAADR